MLKKLWFRFTSWRIGNYIKSKQPNISFNLATFLQEDGNIAVRIRVFACWDEFGDSWIIKLKDGIKKKFKAKEVKIVFGNYV